jgi:hypothetical protein
MPKKPAKPFIRNKDAESFVLVHRSQQDPEYYNEDSSRMVLMSAAAPAPLQAGRRGASSAADGESLFDGGTVASRRSRGGGGGGGGGVGDGATVRTGLTGASGFTTHTARTSRTLPQLRRVRGVLELTEVDESGLPLDGYDYSQHLAEGGGGVFVSADGRVHPGGAGSVARSRGGRSRGAASEARSRRGGGGGSELRESDEEADEEAAREALMGGLYVTHESASRVALPVEVLPSLPEGATKDALDVVTLQEAYMPADLREVLAALDDAEGDDVADWALSSEDLEGAGAAAGKAAPAAAVPAAAAPAAPLAVVKGLPVERLDDGFVLQAMGKAAIPEWEEGAVEDEEREGAAGGGSAGGGKKPFDFDAHVARLMELAEGKFVDADELDEDGDEGRGGGGEWHEDEDDDDDEGDDDDDHHDASSSGQLDDGEGLGCGGGEGGATGLLAAMLSQYADSELGELAEDDARVRADGYAFNTSAPPPPPSDPREQGLVAPTLAPPDASVVRPGMDSRTVLQRLAEDFRRKQQGGDDAIGEYVRAARDFAEKRKALSMRSAEEVRAADAAGGEEGEEGEGGEEEEEEEGGGGEREEKGGASPPAAGGGFRVALPAALSAPAAAAGGGGFKVSLPGVGGGGGGFKVSLPPASTGAPPPAAPAAAAPEGSGPSNIPFGWAEGDFELDALDFFPENWRPSAPAGPRHDVESIVSTYSNTLHHPRRLPEPPASVVSSRSTGGGGPRALGASGAASVGSAADSAGGRVRVGRKSGLPAGVELVVGPGGVSLRQKPGAALPAAVTEEEEEEEEEKGGGSGGSASGSGSEEEGGGGSGSSGGERGGGEAGGAAAAAREKGETPEARRARKAAVKEARRGRRADKKALKVAFKEEARRQVHLAAGRDPIAAHVVKLD